MLTDDLFQDRVGRLISAGRAALAVVALVATWLDPAYTEVATYLLLAGYAAYALVVAALQWFRPRRPPAWALGTHVVDLLVFSFLLYLTDGPTSPFFQLMIFALLSATLRWRWRGALWTMVALLILYTSIVLSAYPTLLSGGAGVQRFLIRTTHLAVVGSILVFFGFYQERISRDVLRIRAAPLDSGDGERLPIRQTLAYAAEIYAARRVVLAWSDPEEPWLYLADWRDGQLEESFVSPDQFDPLVAPSLAGIPFVYRRRHGVLRSDEAGRLMSWHGEAINPAFRDRCGLERAIVLPVLAQGLEGWMFVLVNRAFPPEALELAAVLDAKITAAFDKAAALSATTKAAAAEQRLSLARDLHDGILQFLAGASMQLESIVGSTEDESQRLERLRALRDALVAEQRELRTFIRRLKPGSSQPLAGDLELRPDLAALVDRLESQWRVVVNLRVHPRGVRVPARLQYDLHQLVREAVANAVRHGHSKWINVTANREDSTLHLTVADDGCGLGLHGTLDAAEQSRLEIGPKSLRERVQTLGGTISVTSASIGMLVSMALPLTSGGGQGE